MDNNFTKFLIYFFCAIYSIFSLIKLVFFVITEGINGMKVKTRTNPPPIITDQKWGTHHFLKLKNQGIKLHYVEKGDRSKPLMLFLHGFPECWLAWRHQIEEFSSNYWVVAVDMRGYGDSDKPKGKENYAIEKLVEDIKEFLTELDKPKCTLVAHDWGGVVAWVLVDKYPDMFDKHISLNAPHIRIIRKLVMTNFIQFRKFWYIFFFQCPFLPEIMLCLKDLSIYADILRGPGVLLKAFPDEVIEGFQYYYSQKGAFTPPLNYYRKCFDFDVTSLKEKITVPTLIIWGMEDTALSATIPQLMIPIAEDVRCEEIRNAGHFVHEEKPTEVNEKIWNYLNSK